MADKSRTEVSPSTLTQAKNVGLQPTTYCRTAILSCGRASNSGNAGAASDIQLCWKWEKLPKWITFIFIQPNVVQLVWTSNATTKRGKQSLGGDQGAPRLLGQLNGRAGLSTQRDRWTGGTQSFEWHLKAAGIIDTFKEVFESGMWSRDSRGTEKALLRIFLFVKWSKIQPSLIMEAGSLARLIHLISLLIKLCSNLVSQGNPSESVLPTCATDTGLWKISPSRETWVRQSFSLIPSLHNESTTDSIRPGRAKIELLTK